MEHLNWLNDIFDSKLAHFVWRNGLLIAVTLWLYNGARMLVAGENKKKALKLIIGGTSICIVFGTMSLIVSHMMNKVSAIYPLQTTPQLSEDWGLKLSPEEREKFSLSFASNAFISGKLSHYFDHNIGKWKQYCPSDKDIINHDEMVKNKTLMDYLAKDSLDNAFDWYGFAALALLGGFIYGGNTKDFSRLSASESSTTMNIDSVISNHNEASAYYPIVIALAGWLSPVVLWLLLISQRASSAALFDNLGHLSMEVMIAGGLGALAMPYLAYLSLEIRSRYIANARLVHYSVLSKLLAQTLLITGVILLISLIVGAFKNLW